MAPPRTHNIHYHVTMPKQSILIPPNTAKYYTYKRKLPSCLHALPLSTFSQSLTHAIYQWVPIQTLFCPMPWGLIFNKLGIHRCLIASQGVVKCRSDNRLESLFQIVLHRNTSLSCTLKEDQFRLSIVAYCTPYGYRCAAIIESKLDTILMEALGRKSGNPV